MGGSADQIRRSVAICPEAWRGRVVDLKHRSIRNSSQLLNVLKAFVGRWALVESLTFPQCNPSAAVVQSLKASLPALRCADLRHCTCAGSIRLLAGLPFLETVVLQGHLPKTPLPKLKVLEFCGTSLDLHGEGLEGWRKLPELVPNLESLRVPWCDDNDDIDLLKDATQEVWDRLHEPPMGCKTSDECLRYLPMLNQLKEVNLSEVYTLTDAGLRILGNLPKLERLVLQNMGVHVTKEGLHHLAVGSAPFQFLDMSRCLDTGCRPNAGRTGLVQADFDAFRQRRMTTKVCFS